MSIPPPKSPLLSEGVDFEPEKIVAFGRLPHALYEVANLKADIAAVFRLSDLSIVFMNENGRRRVDPDQSLDLIQFSLNDMLGVGTGEHFAAEALLKVKILGKWSGICQLMDAWGSPFQAEVKLLANSNLRDSASELLYLEATISQGSADALVAALADRELLHALMDTSPDAIYFKDRASRFLRISRSMAYKFGLNDPREAIGKTDFNFFSSDHASPAFQAEKEIMELGKHIVDLEEQETWPDGRVNWVSTSKMPLRDSSGAVVGTFGISRDITISKVLEIERRELETQLQINGKLESIGRLAAGVAHEINTPTQYVATNLEFLNKSFRDLTDAIQGHREILSLLKKVKIAESNELNEAIAALEMIEEQCEIDYLMAEIPETINQSIDGTHKISQIVRSLKEFSHPSSVEKVASDLNRLVDNAAMVSRHEWKYVAELKFEFDISLPPLPCIPDQIGQVILNLIVNAAHAVGDTLRVRNREKGNIILRTGAVANGVFVEVEDDGAGIPEEIRGRIFEPFFTTKAVGKGTGQGLAMVRTIVEVNHKGFIELESKVDVGTKFRVILPLGETHRPPDEQATLTKAPFV